MHGFQRRDVPHLARVRRSTSAYERAMTVTLAHGAGGRSMRRLVTDLFAGQFDPSPHAAVGLAALDDGAVLRIGDQFLVVTTDAHVVSPAFFPGGDIGRLAICGTVNDLAVMGATAPLGITSAIVVEEGYPLEALERIRNSMVEACREAHTTVVAGDTKVMGRGEVDGIVITTSRLRLGATDRHRLRSAPRRQHHPHRKHRRSRFRRDGAAPQTRLRNAAALRRRADQPPDRTGHDVPAAST